MNSEILSQLLEGNKRFREQQKSPVSNKPKVCVVTCADSRLSPELIFDSKLGELFVIRTPGAFISEETLASIHLGLKTFGIQEVIHLPHIDCAALKGTRDPEEVKEHGQNMQKKIQDSLKEEALQANVSSWWYNPLEHEVHAEA